MSGHLPYEFFKEAFHQPWHMLLGFNPAICQIRNTYLFTPPFLLNLHITSSIFILFSWEQNQFIYLSIIILGVILVQ